MLNRYLLFPLTALLLLAAPRLAQAQTGSVGIGTTAPDASAALHIVSSAKGLLLPRLTAAQVAAIASPATGLLVFQIDGKAGFYYNAGTPTAPTWQQVTPPSSASLSATNGLTLTGSTFGLGGALTQATTIGLAGYTLGLTGGNVGIGTSTPTQALDVNGGILARSNGSISNQGAYLQWNRGGGDGATWLLNQQGLGAGGIRFGSATTSNATTEWGRFDGGGDLGLGTNGDPDASAALEVRSSSKGLLPPRLTQTQRDAITSPAAGLTIFNTSTNKLNTWNGTSWDAALSTTEQPVQNPTVTFAYTGSSQTYVVPPNVYSLTIDARGAQGGSPYVNISYSSPGGAGGRLQATVPVVPGETLTINVGGAGFMSFYVGGGGFNGGGNTITNGGGGGGASDVRRGGATLADRILTAGGGGGGGGSGYSPRYDNGGSGGYPNGSPGSNGINISNGYWVGGGGGTQSGPGAGTLDGALGQGGEAGREGCGGGGGGYYGGGAGNRAAGGGGSSWLTPDGTLLLAQTGTSTGNGSVSVTPALAYSAPTLDGRNISGTWNVSGANVYHPSGNVGIGTSSPTQTLDVNGGILARSTNAISNQGAYLQWNRSGGGGETWLLNQQGLGAGGIRFGQSDQSNNATEWARFDSNGNLGIGTASPIAKLHVSGNASATPSGGGTSYFSATTPLQGPGIPSGSGARATAAYFDGGQVWVNSVIVAGSLNTTSDQRIKHVIGLSNRTADLALLNKLRITDYTYIDQVNNTPGLVKKVIAQEVEEVLPTAVSRSRQALPNVYEKATKVSYAQGLLTVTTAKPHELPASGGRMRFYTPANESLDVEVTVVDVHTVRFASPEAHASGLFVYGKYVDDFRSVDYDALTTLNVSATQELARKVAALEATNAALQAGAAAAAATLETFEARLRRLEAGTAQVQR